MSSDEPMASGAPTFPGTLTLDDKATAACEGEVLLMPPASLGIPFCGVAPYIDNECPESTDGQGQNAVVVKNKIWVEREVLRVFFINEIPKGWEFEGQQLTTETILEWANTWKPKGNDKVPEFDETTTEEKGDIRVKFSDQEGCWSMVGTYAQRIPVPDPTMVLNLCNMDCTQGADQRSLVIHEFGHALGMEHEHQRSDFWEVLEKHLNIDDMKDHPRVNSDASDRQKATFGKDWFKRKYGTKNGIKKFFGVSKSEKDRLIKSDYDPESIMHYSFDLDWLKDPDHRNFRKLDSLGLSSKEVMYIKGLHKRCGSLARDPSKEDRSSLAKAYGTG